MKYREPMLLLALAAVPTATLAAQQAGMMGREGHAMMEEMMAPMKQVMRFAPEHLLLRKDTLALSADQVARLIAIRDAAKAAHDAAHAAAMTHLHAQHEAFEAASPDTNAMKQHFQAAHDAIGTAHWAMLAAAIRTRALLTAAQRASVDGLTGAHREGHH
jgi:hypothetical protein